MYCLLIVQYDAQVDGGSQPFLLNALALAFGAFAFILFGFDGLNKPFTRYNLSRVSYF